MKEYIKYKCKSCGKVEYHSARGARNWPNPFLKGCKKTKDGYHKWDSGTPVDEIPKNYK